MTEQLTKIRTVEIVATHTLATFPTLAASDLEGAIGLSLQHMKALANHSPAACAAAAVLQELDTQSHPLLWNAIKRLIRRTLRERAEQDARIAAMDAIMARHWRSS